jgi:hypothetical protein
MSALKIDGLLLVMLCSLDAKHCCCYRYLVCNVMVAPSTYKSDLIALVGLLEEVQKFVSSSCINFLMS